MLLITGCNGQLGRCLADLLTDAICTDVKTLDITNADEVNKFVKDNNIDLIINCAAYTAVDMAQSDSLNAKQINVDGPKNL
ncbi:MAG: sugar nucleotide-binding protein, partial [Alphaproteobacteria bacterium]|nr:sugar nucleotide-binding protein [Alphaproteobacteria bacterium]